HGAQEHDVCAIVERCVTLGQLPVEGERHVRIRFDADRRQKVAERRIARETVRLGPVGAAGEKSTQVGEKCDGHRDGSDVWRGGVLDLAHVGRVGSKYTAGGDGDCRRMTHGAEDSGSNTYEAGNSASARAKRRACPTTSRSSRPPARPLSTSPQTPTRPPP